MEPLFDSLPPEGACKVRLKTLFPRRGGTPVITCDTLTQEAIQNAIDASDSLRKYLTALPEKDRTELGPTPYELRAELQYLGSDGLPIDAPREVVFLYYGTGAAKSAAVDPLALLQELLKNQRDVELAREATRRADAEAREKTTQETIKALTQGMPAIIQTAAAQAGEVAKANAAPLEKAVGELAKAREQDHGRANDATKDVVTLLRTGQQAKPMTLKDMIEVAPAALNAIGAAKKLWN